MGPPDLSAYAGARVVVAMSGGVDSSVAAALLADAGCDVVGVTMKLWNYADVGGNVHNDARCCSAEAFDDARLIAGKMGFPFYVIDLAEQFRRDVINDFISEYQAGRTPNPCVVCNTKIKWSVLEERAQMMNADFLATGHYARIEQDDQTGRYRLLRGIDTARDQSYFLWGVQADALARTIFPLGGLHKSEVRAIARDLGLRNAERPESREICFVADNDYGRFLREKAGVEGQTGPIIDDNGKTVGRHRGVAFYTIGQRKGIGAHGTPAYVTDVDSTTNTVRIGSDDQLYQRSFSLADSNWISHTPPAKGEEIIAKAKIRYRHPPAPAVVRKVDDETVVSFDEPQRAITPGQSAVLYDGDVVLGGGRIKEVGLGEWAER